MDPSPKFKAHPQATHKTRPPTANLPPLNRIHALTQCNWHTAQSHPQIAYTSSLTARLSPRRRRMPATTRPHTALPFAPISTRPRPSTPPRCANRLASASSKPRVHPNALYPASTASNRLPRALNNARANADASALSMPADVTKRRHVDPATLHRNCSALTLRARIPVNGITTAAFFFWQHLAREAKRERIQFDTYRVHRVRRVVTTAL
ncbi:hypothetical protein B0H16DRAFT_1504416 [Mycena metata]|uniref:Uncharacterized protein n=1 Tax=Mycena metata TaxID=1033252 RepID=A0AAD7K2S3_9AGAR|nr:hypothetical protein B0H16DRAFT_1504416 [Mycena metata]